jgi:uncharacterized protein (TIGR00369 family)
MFHNKVSNVTVEYMERTRTYEWADPAEQLKAAQGLSGLEFMRMLGSGTIGRTPMMATLNLSVSAVDEGFVEFQCALGQFMYNPIGVVHGGLAATLMDSVAGSAVHTTLPAGTAYTSTDLSVHYLRPITLDLESVRGIGTVLSRGRRTALGMAEVRDAENRLLAHATSSCMLFPTDA